MSYMDSDGESHLEDRWAEVDQALDEELPFGAGAPQSEEDGQYFFILSTVAPGGNLFQERLSIILLAPLCGHDEALRNVPTRQ